MGCPSWPPNARGLKPGSSSGSEDAGWGPCVPLKMRSEVGVSGSIMLSSPQKP